jgi:hypothetical protein
MQDGSVDRRRRCSNALTDALRGRLRGLGRVPRSDSQTSLIFSRSCLNFPLYKFPFKVRVSGFLGGWRPLNLNLSVDSVI